MNKRLRDQLPGLRPALALIALAFAAGIQPAKATTVAEWAAEKRIVAAESGSPLPGRWRNEVAPYLVEIMDCLTPTPFAYEPLREVTFMKSHQVAGSEAGLNLIGYIVDQQPAPILTVLPSLDELDKYVMIKLNPSIDESPALRAKVRAQKSRDEDGSTGRRKKFRGGFALFTTASSSKGLQMVSVRILICEELSEWPLDVDGRGDPLDLAEYRTTAWSARAKKFYVSTPGIKGSCRISRKYEASDQRRYYVPCPHCNSFQVLRFEQLMQDQPQGQYACAANGCLIEHHAKRDMVAAGHWLKCYPEAENNPAPPTIVLPAEVERWSARDSAGRQPGFHLNQLYSPFVSWADTLAKWQESRGDPRKEKAFTQQVLGEVWEEKGEAPAFQKLFERRQAYREGMIPPDGLFLTAGVDVQGNRLEYGVYAWGVGLTSWLIDRGAIEGDPAGHKVWRELEQRVIEHRYPDGLERLWPIDAIGIDSGFLSSRVYAFCRQHAIDPATRSTRVFALDGRPGWKLPPIGTPRKVEVDYDGRRIGTTLLWPVGTWDLKSELYGALRWTIAGPNDETGNWPIGAAHFGELCDPEFFKQLTAEYLKTTAKANGLAAQEWVKTGPNEAHDIAVYARALARHLSDSLTPAAWAAMAARRAAEPALAQRDMATLWAPGLAPAEPQEPPAEAPAKPAASADDWIGERAERWWN